MKKKTSKATFKRTIGVSCFALLMSFATLAGGTYAWFTDSVTTGKNKIVAGNLDLEVTHTSTATDADGENIQDAEDLFYVEKWEPGTMAAEKITVKNVGDLSLQYSFNVYDFAKNYVLKKSNNINDAGHSVVRGEDDSEYNAAYDEDDDGYYSLADVLKVAVISAGTTVTGGASYDTLNSNIRTQSSNSTFRNEAKKLTYQSFASFVSDNQPNNSRQNGGECSGKLDADGEESYIIVIWWEPNDNAKDNCFNINNNSTVSVFADETSSDALKIEFGLNFLATQWTADSDDYGSDYDSDAKAVLEAAFAGGNSSTSISANLEARDLTIERDSINGFTVDLKGHTIILDALNLNTANGNINITSSDGRGRIVVVNGAKLEAPNGNVTISNVDIVKENTSAKLYMDAYTNSIHLDGVHFYAGKISLGQENEPVFADLSGTEMTEDTYFTVAPVVVEANSRLVIENNPVVASEIQVDNSQNTSATLDIAINASISNTKGDTTTDTKIAKASNATGTPKVSVTGTNASDIEVKQIQQGSSTVDDVTTTYSGVVKVSNKGEWNNVINNLATDTDTYISLQNSITDSLTATNTNAVKVQLNGYKLSTLNISQGATLNVVGSGTIGKISNSGTVTLANGIVLGSPAANVLGSSQHYEYAKATDGTETFTVSTASLSNRYYYVNNTVKIAFDSIEEAQSYKSSFYTSYSKTSDGYYEVLDDHAEYFWNQTSQKFYASEDKALEDGNVVIDSSTKRAYTEAELISADKVAYIVEAHDFAKAYEGLSNALTNVGNGQTIKFVQDYTMTSSDVDGKSTNRLAINTANTFTIDLGGKTLTGRLNVRQGNVTIQNGTVKNAAQPLNVYGSTDENAANYSVLTVASNVTVEADENAICMMNAEGNKTYGAVINVYGTVNCGVEGKEGVALFVSGNIGNDDSVNIVNMNANNTVYIYGKLTSKNDVALAMNGQATVNVMSGATIEGDTAIGVKRGVLNVNSGATITAKGAKVDPAVANTNGTEKTGAAISITSTYNKYGTIVVNVNGGNINSTNNNKIYVGQSKKGSTVYKFVKGYTLNAGSVTDIYECSDLQACNTTTNVTYSDLKTAIAAAAENATIALKNDVVLTATIENSKNLTINMNGHNITATSMRAIWQKANTLTLTGSGSVIANKGEADWSDSSSVIRVGDGSDYKVEAANGTTAGLVVGENVTVSSDHAYGISIFGGATNEVVTVNGKVEAPAPIGTNGKDTKTTPVVEITSTAEITATGTGDAAGYALYLPAAGTYKIDGKITGAGGICAKAGQVNISIGANAVITATGEGHNNGSNGNGAATTNYAVVIENNTSYGYPANITINKGTKITGDIAVYNDANKWDSSLTGGTITFVGVDPATYSVDTTMCEIHENGDNTWTVSAKVVG